MSGSEKNERYLEPDEYFSMSINQFSCIDVTMRCRIPLSSQAM
ncbi:hypothetical protein KL86DYS1_12208 [uncultured Dysgonomonas sp.]|uniref:Uncharacterized protein n=1 Tax=uncultured Dysgonomonas sp. TaxID=206096 RepID=A0A212JGN0_9BACT|nr:hypothetical protein KL86DYS1_12208 [uncultured Dysgonomonas sp.]